MNKMPDPNEVKLGGKKKAGWSVLFVFIAAASIWAVTAQSKSFSVEDFFGFLSEANIWWLLAAVVSMLIFIYTEGAAICSICKAFGQPKNSLSHGIYYSTSDIYFSAITPSATGGQPASAFFMMKDGISPAVTTAALLTNLTVYTFSILIIGICAFLIYPDLFLHFSPLSKTLILLGALVQVLFAAFFILLLTSEKMLERVCRIVLWVPKKLHLLRNEMKTYAKLDALIRDYRECAAMVRTKPSVMLSAFWINFVQRLSQIAVTAFTYMATGGAGRHFLDMLATQSYVVIGSNSIPIPGAMGVSDYLLLDGLSPFMDSVSATNLELLSRSLSFYLCIFICGMATLGRYLFLKSRGKLS